jgi:hypothetical protein
MKRFYGFAGLTIVALVLTACATTTFTSTWKAPDAGPIGPMTGQKVVAFVVVKNDTMRRAAEDALAAELTKRGAVGIAGYTIVADVSNEAKAKALLLRSGAAGVVSMRPVGREQEVVTSPSAYGSHYGPYWGGYYGHGWSGAYSTQEVHINTIVSVETLVYSLKQNKLLWAGQSRTTDPSKVESFVRDVATAAAKQMKKEGVL